MVIKSKCGHTGLGWALNLMTGVFIIREEETQKHIQIQGRRPCEDKDRDQSDEPTSQRMPSGGVYQS